jgi:multidrug efflux pump subunit AcrA (membrane-fusion protein)
MNEHVIPAKEREIPGKLVPASAIPLLKAKAGFRKHWLIAGLATLLAVAMAGAAWWALAARSPVHYVSAQVTRGAVTRAVTATGTVNPELTIIVGAAVSGVIKEVYCDYNTRVTKGQVCAKIDPRPYQTVVDQNKAKPGGCESAARKGQGQPCLYKDRPRPLREPLADARRFPGGVRQCQERLRPGRGPDCV